MRTAYLAAALLAAAAPAFADDYTPAMQAYLASSVRSWASDPVLIDAVKSQNAHNHGLGQADIDALDQAWRAEIGASDTPTIGPVLHNAASDFLRAHVAQSGGVITEVFVMDEHGLNVAASDVTSDMWQGDEAKFTETYPKGADAVHFGDVEFDESSQTYQGQVSIPLVDPATGQVIGAMTIGLNAEALL
jgi:hypothetical protein